MKRKLNRIKTKQLSRRLRKAFNEACYREGWAIFNADGILQIQKLDDPDEVAEAENIVVPTIDDDVTAINMVAEKAMQGSKLHAFALFLDGKVAGDTMIVPEQFNEFYEDVDDTN